MDFYQCYRNYYFLYLIKSKQEFKTVVFDVIREYTGRIRTLLCESAVRLLYAEK